MANKHMKRCSTSYDIWELQIRTTRYHYAFIRLAKIQNTNNTKNWRGYGSIGTFILLMGMLNGTLTLKNGSAVSYKMKHTLTIQSTSHAPWYLPKLTENLCLHKNLHTMFRAALLTAAKIWK